MKSEGQCNCIDFQAEIKRFKKLDSSNFDPFLSRRGSNPVSLLEALERITAMENIQFQAPSKPFHLVHLKYSDILTFYTLKAYFCRFFP
jgi:hypothetical protein